MKKQAVDKKGRKVRFIRVNGRVIPIRDKDPTKSQMRRNYDKYGDGANQASRIDSKYERKAMKAGTKGGLVAVAGFSGAYLFKSSKLKVASAALGLAGAIHGNMKANKVRKKNAVKREREYVRAFGTTSAGDRPSRRKSGV